MAYSKPPYRDITSFSFNYADFPPVSSKSSALDSLQSSETSSNPNFPIFTKRSFAKSVLKSNNSHFPLGTTSIQNSCFSPSAHNYCVGSAPVKKFLSLSSNFDNSLVSIA